ncbi:AEC family transporter [Microlunatus sp. GCM10028923]|uniref:AEC family transporter n=1 Tax=Microlunatus sp. GCM10028923 TaxID=3273400 RepID=UPI00361E0E94
MLGVLEGFVTIIVIIVLGVGLAHFKIVELSGQVLLSRISFFVASPALMITVLGGTDVSTLFSANLMASIGSVMVTGVIALILLRVVWRRSGAETVIGIFSAAYVNAGNLGLPIAAYALGDASLIAPMLLVQLLVLQPIGIAVLDLTTRPEEADRSRRRRLLRLIGQPFRNPLMIASLIGLILSVTGFQLPRVINDPLHLVGGMAVPAMLLAYGISLRLGPLPGRGEPPVQIGTLVGLKLIVQPLIGFLLAKFVVGLDPLGVLAVTVIAGLPTAQNVFTHAVRFDRGIVLARDTIFLSTLGSIPLIAILAAVLG